MSEVQIRSTHAEAARTAQRLRAARIAIAQNDAWRWYAGFFHIGNDIVAESSVNGVPIETAATDFRNRYYNPAFMATLSQPELVFVMLHEVAHMLHRHNATYTPAMKAANERNDASFIRLAPLAIDYAVNSTIVDSLEWVDATSANIISKPESVLYDARFRSMSWMQIYAILKSESRASGSSLDDHLDESQEGESKQAGDTPGEGDEQESAQEFEAKLARELSAAEARRRAGKGSLADSRTLLETSAKALPWQQVFRNAVRSVMSQRQQRVTWARPSRRAMSRQDLLPGPVPTKTLTSLVIVGDTSGSIGEEELAATVAQALHITRATPPDLMHVLWVDHEVSSHQVFTPRDYGTLRQQLKPTGGGGTDMRAAMEYVAENHLNPAAMVVFTDGYTPFPEPDENFGYPVWWLITSAHITSPHGMTIRF